MTRVRYSIVPLLAVLLCLSGVLTASGADLPQPNSIRKAAPDPGERIYREGILPSGKTLLGFIKGDLQAFGSSFTCDSCHMRSGLGSLEGNVLTTPTNGPSLYQPRNVVVGPRPGMVMGRGKSQPPPPPPPPRPAYTDETLAAALRGGVDPSGRVFDQIMPRYNLNESDMAELVSYLKRLSSGYSPGVDAETLRFATVITDDLPPEQSKQHLALLNEFVSKTNDRTDYIEHQVTNSRVRRQLMTSGRVAYRKLSLSVWQLKGAPETWRAQLDEQYRKEPVFALLGGMSGSVWKPVHLFCEENRIPCLFPQTDIPVISDTDWYTLYLSKGYYQEGEAAARFLGRRDDVSEQARVLVVYRDSAEGNMLKDGFNETWASLGRAKPVVHAVADKSTLSPERLNALIVGEKPDVVVIWDNNSAVPAINSLPAGALRPALKIVVSAGYLGTSYENLGEQVRGNTYLTYAQRLPQDEKTREAFFYGAEPDERKRTSGISDVAKRTYPLTRILSQALMEMKEQFYRDYLFDLIGMIKDLEVPMYERMSFGPGQRYASKGCYVVQLGKGSKPELISRSDWVIH